MILTCQQCNTTFTTTDKDRKNCSRKCANHSRRTRYDVVCVECGISFQTIKYHIDHGTKKYCSRACSLKHTAVKPPVRNPNTKAREQIFRDYYNTIGGRAEHMLNNARGRGKKKGIAVTITSEWIQQRLENGKCEVTGIPFVLESNGGKGHKTNSFSPSIDRIDQEGDYSPENCRIVVWIYNRARGAFPDGDFDVLLEALRK